MGYIHRSEIRLQSAENLQIGAILFAASLLLTNQVDLYTGPQGHKLPGYNQTVTAIVTGTNKNMYTSTGQTAVLCFESLHNTAACVLHDQKGRETQSGKGLFFQFTHLRTCHNFHRLFLPGQ